MNTATLAVLVQMSKGRGAPSVTLNCLGRRRSLVSVHTLVASAYVANPNGYSVVEHKDGDQTNNRASNLMWCVGGRGRKRTGQAATVPGFFPIPGRDGYFINNFGQVRDSNSNIVPCLLTSDGHTRHSLGGACEGTHRLVANTFLPNPECKPCVNHINGLPWDNRVENLEWCTIQENVRHAVVHGLHNTKGERHGRSRLTSDAVLEIRTLCAKGRNRSLIAAQFGISRKYVSEIFLGHAWKHTYGVKV